MFLIAIIASAAYSFTATPVYHSTSRVFISTDATGSADTFYAGAFTAQRVASYADLATSRELMQRVIKRLHLNLTPAELAQKVNATVVTDTVIILVDITDPSAQVAQRIAQVEAEELTRYLTEVETPNGSTEGNGIKATIVDPASYDANAVSPKTVLNILVAGVLGLIIGFGTAVVRELLDNTISSAEDVEKTVDSSVLASIAFDGDVPKSPLITTSASHAPRVEAFRLLRTNLQFLNLDRSPKSLVITSAVPGEGKTSTATNLAIALAQTGRRVLLIDGDLRRPKAASLLGLERSVGFTTVLVGRGELAESIQRHAESGIYFLASGPVPPNPTEVLQSQAAKALLERVTEMFDMVIVDAPPLLPVSDPAILARDVDGAILVVRHGKTTRDQLRYAAARLDQVGAKMLGVVVNMTSRHGDSHYSYEYGYGHEYGPENV